MNNYKAGYVLAVEVISPSGMNLEISTNVAKADLALFEQKNIDEDMQQYICSQIEYTEHETFDEKLYEMVSYIVNALIEQVPKALKPIAILLNTPEETSAIKMADWLGESAHAKNISNVEIVHSSGPSFVLQTIKSMERHDSLMCISVDSLVSCMADLIDQGLVMSKSNPWGVIPSEGAAGLVLCKNNIIDTLKLSPRAQFGYLDLETNSDDRRGLLRLVQRASKRLDFFGEVFSDLTNLRLDTEDYGFAIGARAEFFLNPQQPNLINDLWGTMGRCSSIALIGYAIETHDLNEPVCLLMSDMNSDKAFLQLHRYG